MLVDMQKCICNLHDGIRFDSLTFRFHVVRSVEIDAHVTHVMCAHTFTRSLIFCKPLSIDFPWLNLKMLRTSLNISRKQTVFQLRPVLFSSVDELDHTNLFKLWWLMTIRSANYFISSFLNPKTNHPTVYSSKKRTENWNTVLGSGERNAGRTLHGKYGSHLQDHNSIDFGNAHSRLRRSQTNFQHHHHCCPCGQNNHSDYYGNLSYTYSSS